MSFWRPPTYRPLTPEECVVRASAVAPSLRRRMTSFIYEGVLLFGIVVPVALIYGVVTNQRHALHGRAGLGLTLALVLLLYFGWCWFHTGQTLAMKTWHLKLVTATGGRLSPAQVAWRYLTMWTWFVPPILAAQWLQWHSTRQILGAMVVWVALYALSSFLLPRRQFLHDLLSGTRVIDTRPDLPQA